MDPPAILDRFRWRRAALAALALAVWLGLHLAEVLATERAAREAVVAAAGQPGVREGCGIDPAWGVQDLQFWDDDRTFGLVEFKTPGGGLAQVRFDRRWSSVSLVLPFRVIPGAHRPRAVLYVAPGADRFRLCRQWPE